MNEVIENLPADVGMGNTPQSLSLIHSCAVAVWRRRSLESFQSWIDGLDAEMLPSARMNLPADRVHEAVLQICEASGTPDCDERAMLVDDVAALADIFCGVMSASFVQLRLDVLTNNDCQKFYLDAIKARLVCTYRGAGTQYVMSRDGIESQRVYTVPTGAPVLLRGTLWQNGARPVMYHRSPPIKGTEETRLVLGLHPVDEPQ